MLRRVVAVKEGAKEGFSVHEAFEFRFDVILDGLEGRRDAQT